MFQIVQLFPVVESCSKEENGHSYKASQADIAYGMHVVMALHILHRCDVPTSQARTIPRVHISSIHLPGYHPLTYTSTHLSIPVCARLALTNQFLFTKPPLITITLTSIIIESSRTLILSLRWTLAPALNMLV